MTTWTYYAGDGFVARIAPMGIIEVSSVDYTQCRNHDLSTGFLGDPLPWYLSGGEDRKGTWWIVSEDDIPDLPDEAWTTLEEVS